MKFSEEVVREVLQEIQDALLSKTKEPLKKRINIDAAIGRMMTLQDFVKKEVLDPPAGFNRR